MRVELFIFRAVISISYRTFVCYSYSAVVCRQLGDIISIRSINSSISSRFIGSWGEERASALLKSIFRKTNTSCVLLSYISSIGIASLS